MTIEEQLRLFEELTNKASSILKSKGDDYSEDNDRLSNFKNGGAICGITTSQQCLSLIATKIARLGVLFKNKQPKNESIEDSIVDLFNYIALLYMIEKEKQTKHYDNSDRF